MQFVVFYMYVLFRPLAIWLQFQ